MSAFNDDRLRTMKVHNANDAGDLRIIRPLIYICERRTIEFAHRALRPLIADGCPACFRVPTQRLFHYDQLLAQQEKGHKRLCANLLVTIRSLMGSNRRN